MKKISSLLLSILLTSYVYGQAKINVVLKRELDSIYVLDQQYRSMLGMLNNKVKKDSLAKVFNVPAEDLNGLFWQKQEQLDKSNLIRVEEIIKQHGYPGKTLVGTPANEATFYVIQHSDKIKEYIPFIEKAARAKELPFDKYATMLDRFLMQQNKEQIYGTQVRMFLGQNPQTLQKEQYKIVWPIKDPVNVNKLRREAGITKTVEELAQYFGFEYKVVTLAQYDKMLIKE